MKKVLGKILNRIRDIDFNFQAKSEINKDKWAQRWRVSKIKLKKIPFVAFAVKVRNKLRRIFRNSKLYVSLCDLKEKIITPDVRRRLWDIKRSMAYRFGVRALVLALSCFVALIILNGTTSAQKSSASEVNNKVVHKTGSGNSEIKQTPSSENEDDPQGTDNPNKDNEFKSNEDNSKWLVNANKNVFPDKYFKNINGYKYYVKNNKVVSALGVDVSSYQGKIDWAKVKKAGIKFAMIRLGIRGHKTGKIRLDTYFKYNIENARKNGVLVGVYFSTQAINTQEALEEANFVINCLKGYKIDMPVVLDMEYAIDEKARTKLADMNNELRTDIAICFMERIKKAGYLPMFYSCKNWLESAVQLSRLNNYCIWYARYNNYPAYKYRYHMWQYTETGRVDGIQGNVDLNVGMVNFRKLVNKN